jgi:hypothetical protein
MLCCGGRAQPSRGISAARLTKEVQYSCSPPTHAAWLRETQESFQSSAKPWSRPHPECDPLLSFLGDDHAPGGWGRAASGFCRDMQKSPMHRSPQRDMWLSLLPKFNARDVGPRQVRIGALYIDWLDVASSDAAVAAWRDNFGGAGAPPPPGFEDWDEATASRDAFEKSHYGPKLGPPMGHDAKRR